MAETKDEEVNQEVDHEAVVRTLVAAAGLTIPDDEIERLARLYPGLRRSVDRYYDVPVGDEVMASVFRAADGDAP
jgi:hypothetical protein